MYCGAAIRLAANIRIKTKIILVMLLAFLLGGVAANQLDKE